MKINCVPIEYASPEMHEALALRKKVLRIPLGLEFFCDDIQDEWDSFHLAAITENEDLVGVLVLKPQQHGIVKMRQLAVQPECQQGGIGKKLVLFSEVFAKYKDFSRIELHARMEAVPFYLKLGYLQEGKTFKEVGIDHVFMYKDLSKAQVLKN